MPESTCPGPFIWYPCEAGGAVLHCATCGQVTVTCNWNDEAHTETPVLMEGVW